MKEKRCRCGFPSLPGLVPGVGLCQRHYNEHMWGKNWAKECMKDNCVSVHDHKTGSVIIYKGLYPEEAVRNAYAQREKNDHNTWDYQKYNDQVKRNGRVFSCGTFRKPKGHKEHTRFTSDGKLDWSTSKGETDE